MDPKEEAMQALHHEVSSTVPEVRKLMGFLSYYTTRLFLHSPASI